jgi:hypothetical protein
LSVGRTSPHGNRFSICLAKSGESQLPYGCTVFLAQGRGAVGLERWADRLRGWRLRVEAKQFGLVHLDGQSHPEVVLGQGPGPQGVAAGDPLAEEAVAVRLDVAVQEGVGAANEQVGLADPVRPAPGCAELRDFGVLLALKSELSDGRNAFNHLPFGSHSGTAGRFIVRTAQ